MKDNNKIWATVANVGYKLVLLGGIIGLAVCNTKQYKDYKNVVIENKDNKLLLEDVATKTQRIVNYEHPKTLVYDFLNDFAYIKPGDTIVVKNRESEYNASKYVSWEYLVLNQDTLDARQRRENMLKTKQR